jgi:hypothetical protein
MVVLFYRNFCSQFITQTQGMVNNREKKKKTAILEYIITIFQLKLAIVIFC